MDENNRWVEEHLAQLDPEAEWKPQVTTALARLEAKRAEESRLPIWPRALSVVAVAAICIVTFPQPRALAQRVITPCVEACESLVLGQADFHDGVHQLMWTVHSFLGLTAPNFEATDAAGVNFHLSEYAGKIVLLNFWASWCAPCQKEIPWFAEFQKEYGKNGFAVVGVSLDEDGWKTVRPQIAALKINYRVTLGNDALTKKYGGVEALPETLLIGRDGQILRKHVGITSREQYEREIVRAVWSQLSDADRDRLRAKGL